MSSYKDTPAYNADLSQIYGKLPMKQEVYRQWIGNLEMHLFDADPAKVEEADRRIKYIETNLIRRVAA